MIYLDNIISMIIKCINIIYIKGKKDQTKDETFQYAYFRFDYVYIGR